MATSTATPGATPDSDFPPFTLLDEIDADLADAGDALQGLMALMQGCDPEQTIQAGHLRGLLQWIAVGVRQARANLAVINH